MSRRIVDAIARARRSKPATADWMPLAEAARALRQALRGTDLDRMAHGLSTSEDNLLAFWAQQVAAIDVPVHGSRIMATRREVVAKADMLGGRLLNQASRLDVGHGEPTQDICDLMVKRRDLEAGIARVATGGASRA